ncbi:MAG: hypothetical protein P1U56_16215 [Saprospiraceae bacterium]|nr:hypothetical protein [Saprospiraceae bacterium]
MRIIKIFSILILGAFIISSCGDKDPRDVNAVFQINVGDDALAHETTYVINDTKVKFTNVAFYLGDMTFETSDGSVFESTPRYTLVKPGSYEFNFTVPEDVEEDVTLSKIDFFIGVDATTNAETEMDFTEREVGDPLGQQNPSMHWGWAGGYRFLAIDGFADLDDDGEFEQQLVFHLGFDDFLKLYSISPNAKIEEGSNQFEVIFDLNEFLSGLNFEEENFTKVQPDNIELANKLFANYNSSIRFVAE